MGSRREHPMDAAHLLSVVPTVRESDIYICGPKALVWAVVQAAEELGISHDRVHHEEFEFHKTVVNTSEKSQVGLRGVSETSQVEAR